MKHVQFTHATMVPIVRDPHLIPELSMAIDLSRGQHPVSTHSEYRCEHSFVGLETASVRLFKQYMKTEAYHYRPEQWPDVVLKGMKILNKHTWFRICAFILGVPGEKKEHIRESLDLLFALKDARWCVIPTLFDARLAAKEG